MQIPTDAELGLDETVWANEAEVMGASSQLAMAIGLERSRRREAWTAEQERAKLQRSVQVPGTSPSTVDI